jgi:hypothetical protein
MPPSPSRPSRLAILLTLAAAAVIGFLVGALAAVTQTDEGATRAAPTDTTPPTSTSSPSRSPAPTTTPAPTNDVEAEISLTADRARAATDELIRLEGVLRPPGGDVTLQVQQSVDGIGFVDFPVTATTRSDGSFGVWVRTGRVGSNEFRMVTEIDGTQVVSNAVAVQVS